MMIAFITFNSSLVPFIEGLSSSNPGEVEFSGFRGKEQRKKEYRPTLTIQIVWSLPKRAGNLAICQTYS